MEITKLNIIFDKEATEAKSDDLFKYGVFGTYMFNVRRKLHRIKHNKITPAEKYINIKVLKEDYDNKIKKFKINHKEGQYLHKIDELLLFEELFFDIGNNDTIIENHLMALLLNDFDPTPNFATLDSFLADFYKIFKDYKDIIVLIKNYTKILNKVKIMFINELINKSAMSIKRFKKNHNGKISTNGILDHTRDLFFAFEDFYNYNPDLNVYFKFTYLNISEQEEKELKLDKIFSLLSNKQKLDFFKVYVMELDDHLKSFLISNFFQKEAIDTMLSEKNEKN